MLTRVPYGVVAVGMVLSTLPARALGESRVSNVVRLKGDRLGEVYEYAQRRSPSFRELIATLELLQRTIDVEEGGCNHPDVANCPVPVAPTARSLVIHVNPRLPLQHSAAQLAHALYHAVEVSREPTVTDAESVRQLFARTGENACRSAGGECWETRAAQAFEQLVRRELLERDPADDQGRPTSPFVPR